MTDDITLFPAEWYPQSGIQLTWPHENTDWAPMLDEVETCFTEIARTILRFEPLIVVCKDEEHVRGKIGKEGSYPIICCETETNDTWARDHGGISVFKNGVPTVYDFVFNGWGLKYPANYDNIITASMVMDDLFAPDVMLENMRPFVLEGGSIESDGEGTLLTTEECLCSLNRNDYLCQEELESYLKDMFGLKQVLWLTHGYLAGDDTDSHIDTLARFCDPHTIAYACCDDPDDEHYEELQEMQVELESFRQLNGEPYKLIPLPMADIRWEGERLPATYANFLILNGAVLMPVYGLPGDAIAKSKLEKAFPGREIIPIDCLPLIKQHGSLHCVTMQYPKGFIK